MAQDTTEKPGTVVNGYPRLAGQDTTAPVAAVAPAAPVPSASQVRWEKLVAVARDEGFQVSTKIAMADKDRVVDIDDGRITVPAGPLSFQVQSLHAALARIQRPNPADPSTGQSRTQPRAPDQPARPQPPAAGNSAPAWPTQEDAVHAARPHPSAEPTAGPRSSPSADPPTTEFPAVMAAPPAPTTRGGRGQSDPTHRGEYALLGSLLHAPTVLPTLQEFLGPREFSRHDTRALFAAVSYLHSRGALVDVGTITAATEVETAVLRTSAASQNLSSVISVLQAKPAAGDTAAAPGGTGAGTSSRSPVATPSGTPTLPAAEMHRLLAAVMAAAPAECAPFRGVFDPSAQLWMGRQVLENSIHRKLTDMGVRLQRTTTPPLLAATTARGATRGARATQAMASNLHAMEAQVDALADRLAKAVHRTQPSNPATPAAQPVQAQQQSARMRGITARRVQRSEQHLIHLALHAGSMKQVPKEVLEFRAEDFSTPAHANTWRAIQDVHARGWAVNYQTVDCVIRYGAVPYPTLDEITVAKLATSPPAVKPEKVARSLRTVVTAALNRAQRVTQHTVAAAATRGQPAETALHTTRTALKNLTARTTHAVKQHHDSSTIANSTTGAPTQRR